MTEHVVMFSGGAGSFAAADRVVREHGRDILLVFADTIIEDADLYRFLIETAAQLTGRAGRGEISGLAATAAATPPSSDIGARKRHLAELRAESRRIIPRLVWLADGRTIWEVFHDERFLGNARIGVCSRELKQRVIDEWLKQHCDRADTVIHVGIDWTEEHRFLRLRERRGAEGWRYNAPLCSAPYETKEAAFVRLKTLGIEAPRLYRLGFSHNNCGGGCVRAGVGHFTHLLRAMPDVFEEWERSEQAVRDYLQRDDVAMLRDRAGGESKPLTLHQLRRRIEAGYQPDLFEIGGCGCFIDPEDAA